MEALAPASILIPEHSIALHAITLNNAKLKLEQGKVSSTIPERAKCYNEAFLSIRLYATAHSQLTPEIYALLIEVLNRYAINVRYAQRDGQDEIIGFRDCAALLELSIQLQFDHLKLSESTTYNWKKAESIEELISLLKLESNPLISEMMTFSSQVHSFSLENALNQSSADRPIVAEALTSLIASYQNIPETRTVECRELHKGLQRLTKIAIGNETLEQQLKQADLNYNRTGFMIGLFHDDPTSDQCTIEKIKSYDEIEAEYEKLVGASDPRYIAKASQCNNMRGILCGRLSQKDYDIILGVALKARELRLKLPVPTNPEDLWNNRVLLANNSTVIIDAATKVKLDEPIATSLNLAIEIAQFMIDGHNEGKNHAYTSSYVAALHKMSDYKDYFTDEQFQLILTALKLFS